jgi:hypothetical protein
MKKLKQLVLASVLGMLIALPASAVQRQAVVTFYWPGEDGGRRACDGKVLEHGDAAVNFDQIPKGSAVKLKGCNGTLNVTANDCGGSAVMSRRAARERGFFGAIVVDVWASSQRSAREMESELLGSQIGRGSVVCEFDEPSRKEAVFKKDVNGRPRLDFYARTTTRPRPSNSSKSKIVMVYNSKGHLIRYV